jgi:hypothetical protein
LLTISVLALFSPHAILLLLLPSESFPPFPFLTLSLPPPHLFTPAPTSPPQYYVYPGAFCFITLLELC